MHHAKAYTGTRRTRVRRPPGSNAAHRQTEDNMDCTMQEAIDIIASDSAIGEIVDERLAQENADNPGAPTR